MSLLRPQIHRVGIPPAGADVLWRAEARRYSYCSDPDYDIWSITSPCIELSWYIVERRTPCGARLDGGRFVRLTAAKRWACSTPQEAIESLIARRKRQISILGNQLRRAREELVLAEAAMERVTAEEKQADSADKKEEIL